MLILIVVEHQGDWRSFRKSIKEGGRSRSNVEGKMNHLNVLQERLRKHSFTPQGLIEDIVTDRKILKKARAKVYQQDLQDRDKTSAMRNTPRRKLKARALRGNWAPFSVSPAHFEDRFTGEIQERKFYSANASFGLAERLESKLRSNIRQHEGCPEDLLAIYRSFLTAIIEAFDRVDDSFGEVGEVFKEPLRAYLSFPWTKTSITAEVYYRDILEFITWEDYGQTSRNELMPFFKSIAQEHVPLVAKILSRLREELIDSDLDYQAEEALTLLGMLRIAQRQYDMFPELADEMGSRHWERITTMAEAAWDAGHYDVAHEVFQAAEQPGFHRKYLKEQHQKLSLRRSRRKTSC
jgi:hypothetical protein